MERDNECEKGDKSVRTRRRPSSFVAPFIETTDLGEKDCEENCQVADEMSCND